MTVSAPKQAKRTGSHIALAIALLCGSAVGLTAFADTAHAQRKKDKKNKAGKPDYSKGFVAAYTPLNTLSQDPAADAAALKAGVPGVVAAMETADDKLAGGGLIYNIGIATKDLKLQRQALDMMLNSGKLPADRLEQYILTAGQLASDDGDFAAARKMFMRAIAGGYSGSPGLEGVIAESYFDEEKYAEGLAYLKDEIEKKKSAGLLPDEGWLRRGVAVAYTNDLAREAVVLSAEYARLYPSTTSWGDAIAIQRNYFDYDNNAMLDLLRLADRTGSLRDGRDYADYIESADARRLPGEVKRVAAAGVAAGLLESNDPFVVEAQSIASQRLAADKADLPALERDARKSSSTALTATAAGDAMLSYGMSAKAEEMYMIASNKSGADMPRVLTRLGIAQADQGKNQEAAATFAKVTGVRGPIATLWSIYAEQNAAPVADTAESAASAM
ncbi:hypothetical protein HKD42_05195 [Altererythrobacter sp. RZ02]|uniref:Tetratricopeptide repeat protein n=1 Tax=Pontixanthobacter rizhaonensis TaxID=2730337 RepID=A0A848QQR4_9SPHN|nr:hypothetical protein [Pontixanthobacter rizhaonensis]NMW31448.1 hypothetical protein [Pontixanthobacter rizhaonensis]